MSKEWVSHLCCVAAVAGCGGVAFDEAAFEGVGSASRDDGDASTIQLGRSEQSLYLDDSARWWTQNENEVPICFQGDKVLFFNERNWIVSALNNTWEAESSLNINFKECPATHTEKYLKLALVSTTGGPGGASGFGMDETFLDSSQPAGTRLFINPGVTTRQTVEFLAVHEIGHALGFSHEFLRPDFEVSCTRTSGGGLFGNTVLGEYDPLSVMTYEYDFDLQQPDPCRAQLPGGSLSPGDKLGVAEMYARTGAQVLGATGALKHAVLRVHDWVGWGDVETHAGEIGNILNANMAYRKRGASHLLAITSNGGMFYTSRSRSGAWTAFDNVRTRTGFTGSFSMVAVADINDAAHVLGVNSVGLNRRLQHAIRSSNNTWTAFGDVSNAVPGPDIGNVWDISATALNGELHVCLVAAGKLLHTVRFANGNWSAFDDVESAVGQDKGNILQVDCTAVAGHLHLVTLDSSGGLWHTVRRGITGEWLSFGDVRAAADDPGSVADISTAQWGGRLFVSVLVGGRIKVAMRYGDDDWNNLGADWYPFEDANSLLGHFSFTTVGMD